MTTRRHGSEDEGQYYFQSASAQSISARRAEKSKSTAGAPLKLNAKLSSIVRDEREEGCVFVADNGGGVRRVDLKTNKTTHTYRGPRNPITSITVDPSGTILFAGCWDNTIWSWNVSSGKQRQRYSGHSDFVNCVTCCEIALRSTAETDDQCLLLISGSVDATIIVWRASTGERLHTLKGHTRGVLDLAIDPMSSLLSQPQSPHPETIYLLSAASTPEIRSWRITYSSAAETMSTLAAPADEDEQSSTLTSEKLDEQALSAVDSAPLTFHATSVNKILFSPSSSGAALHETALFTASSDNTAQCLTRPIAASSSHDKTSPQDPQPKPQPWTSTDTFTHPDWVRAITHDPETGLLVTGCRDEEVRIWDTSSGECVKTFTGHFESVEGICWVNLEKKSDKDALGKRQEREKWIISVSLDGTLRRWRLDGNDAQEDGEDEDIEQEELVDGIKSSNGKAGKGNVLTTEDEDQELADLMAELEDD